MALTRRLFARAMAAAPMAAQALAKMGAGSETMSHKGIFALGSDIDDAPVPTLPIADDENSWIKDRIEYMLKRIKEGLNDEEKERAMLMARQTLDPDLAYLRSFSASTLVQMQYQRNCQRLQDRNKGWMQREVDAMKKQIGLA